MDIKYKKNIIQHKNYRYLRFRSGRADVGSGHALATEGTPIVREATLLRFQAVPNQTLVQHAALQRILTLNWMR